MDAKTLKALKASIEKWERNAVAETPGEFLVTGRSCALCVLFAHDICVGCPVRKRTGKSDCRDTPYEDARFARADWIYGCASKEQAHAAAREEVAFLKSLLPEEST